MRSVLAAAREAPWAQRVVLGGTVLAIVLVQVAWGFAVGRLPSWDQAHHLTVGAQYAEAIRDFALLHRYWDVAEPYPPGFHLMLAVATLIGGGSANLGLVVNLLLFPVLLGATYRIGQRLYGRFEATVAAVLVGLYPMSALFMREALIEFSLTAWAALALAVFLETDGFERRRPSILLGVICGWGLLLKPNFAFYVWLPLVIAGAACVFRRRWRALGNAAAVAALAVFIASSWYLPQWESAVRLATVNRDDARRWGHVAEAWPAFMHYLRAAGDDLLTGVGALIAFAGLILEAFRRARRSWPLVAAVVGTFAVLVFLILYRDSKYLLPLAPVMALGAASLVGRLTPKLQVPAAAALVVFHAVHFSAATLGRPGLSTPSVSVAGTPFKLWKGAYTWGGLESGQGFGVPPLIDALAARATAKSVVAVAPNMQWLNTNLLAWAATRRGLSVRFEGVSDPRRITRSTLGELRWFDFVIVKTGDQGHHESSPQAVAMADFVRWNPRHFTLLRRIETTDGGVVGLYEVNKAVMAEAMVENAVADSTTFGSRFELSSVHWERVPNGLQMKLGWTALTRERLTRQVAVHILDEGGHILSQADYGQGTTRPEVAPGDVWTDTVLLRDDQLLGARRVGLCLYDAAGRLPVGWGTRDNDDTRMLVDLPKR